MEHSTSGEANSHSPSQIPRRFVEPKGSSPCSQEATISPYPEPDETSPVPSPCLKVKLSLCIN
jgi:hypothetical protein